VSPGGGAERRDGTLARGTWPVAAVSYERFELPGGRSAPARARTIARDRLGHRLGEPRRNDLLLLVTELVTNAVRHGGVGPDAILVLHLAAAERVLRVEVCDGGPGFTAMEREPGPHGGFGLLLLRSLPERWGIATDDGTCVWFELDVEPLSAQRSGGEPPRR
jgi:anti-sigma regulatory factor (Ser/Thr protein kinase)